jgi:hypothetical protein
MKIPCKDCLCFPVCKSQAVTEDFCKEECISLPLLYNKCELFSKWYGGINFFNSVKKAEITECFGIASVSWFVGLWQ